MLADSMKEWRTDLISNASLLGSARIRREIFQGDKLLPLLHVLSVVPLTRLLRKVKRVNELSKDKTKINDLFFMDDFKLSAKNQQRLESLIHTVRIVRKDIRTEFGFEKCASVMMKRRKVLLLEEIDMPDGNRITSMKDREYYKYLGILERDKTKRKEVKRNILKEYHRRVRKVLKLKCNGSNTIKAINIWAISLVRYSRAFSDWTREKLREMDLKTRKLMTMHGTLHLRAHTSRLYIHKKDGGGSLISIEDYVDQAAQGLQNYISKSTKRILRSVRACDVSELDEREIESTNEWKERKQRERKDGHKWSYMASA